MYDIPFNILTYNVFSFPKSLENTAQYTRMNGILKGIEKIKDSIDVIVFTELWSEGLRDTVSKSMKNMGFTSYSGTIPRHYIKILNGGVHIYSKWEITHTAYITYNSCTREDCLSSKGALYGRVCKRTDSGKFPFNIIATHLNVGKSGREPERSIQKTQVAQLSRFIKERRSRLRNPAEPFIVTGDLNMERDKRIDDFNTALNQMGMVDYTDIPFSKRANTTLQRNPTQSNKTYLFDYILWDNITSVSGSVTNLYKLFQLENPLSNVRQCFLSIGRKYFDGQYIVNATKNITDLSDHDPILGKFIVTFEKEGCSGVETYYSDTLYYFSRVFLKSLPLVCLFLLCVMILKKLKKKYNSS